MYLNLKITYFGTRHCQKYASHPKKFEMKVVSCWILYKKVHERICLSPSQSGATGLERLICFKYYIVLKWKSRFTLELDTAKNTHYMRKRFEWKLLTIEFWTKVSGRTSPSPQPQSVAGGLCVEFNVQQLLFEMFSHIIRIFGSVKPQTESICLFQ